MQNLKTFFTQSVKNIYGWKTRRKIVVISVDDYGNVRVDSKNAREQMDKKGLKTITHFDQYDSLENETDLQMLYDVLTSVKDKNNRHAVFTPFALPCNINFEKVIDSDFTEFHYELLPETLKKLKGYQHVHQLIREGISQRIFLPQFHGREHLNLKLFKENILDKDYETIEAIKNRSYTSISGKKYSTISYTAAFDFDKFEENYEFDEIIASGLKAFEAVYGYPAVHFNAPGGREHPYLHKALLNGNVKYIDTPWIKKEHQGEGIFKKIINHTGKKNQFGQTFLVRNCVFEPGFKQDIDAVNFCLKQIEFAFKWNRPANISSHRVNYCGNIDSKNRENGLSALKRLLKAVVKRWPEVEFFAANDLADLVVSSQSKGAVKN